MPVVTEPVVHGVHADCAILTAKGWKRARDVPPGAELAHPLPYPSTLTAVTPVGRRRLVTLGLADGSSIRISATQPVQVEIGAGKRLKPTRMTGDRIREAILAGVLVRLPRHEPYVFGHSATLPLDPWVLGALLGDGYLRQTSVQWCNENPEMHELMRQALPPGASITPLRVGQAGTGSATIVAEYGRHNPVLLALQCLGLSGSRAWEKYIPPLYLDAELDSRLALLQGINDTDGSIDTAGRIEFSSSSEQLAVDVLALVQGLGGRATLSRRTNITFTSPRQATPKAARDAFRLTGIRLPEDIRPFRRPHRASRVCPGRVSRQWKVVAVTDAGTDDAVVVNVSATDGQWIGDSYVTLTARPDRVAVRAA